MSLLDKKSKFIVLALSGFFIFFNLLLTAQTCATNGLVLTRQGQIDSFPITFGVCDIIDGYLIISGGTNITDLAGLQQLKRINDNLIISGNTNLKSLWGLNNLIYVGGSIEIAQNDRLQSIFGMNNIARIDGDLEISNNSLLTNLFGFNQLKSIGGVLLIYENSSLKDFEKNLIWGNLLTISVFPKLENALGLLIGNNPSIIEVDGFPVLDSIDIGFDISKNHAMEHITGFDKLESVGFMRINENNLLQEIQGLNSLSTIKGNFYLEDNPSLITFTGLANLDTVFGNLRIIGNDSLLGLENLAHLKLVGSLSIGHNDRLINLDGLSNLSHILKDLWIYNNPELSDLLGLGKLRSINGTLGILQNGKLSSLHGLDLLNPHSIKRLHLASNIMLRFCTVASICEYLQSYSNYDIIYGNSTGCERADLILCNCSLSYDCEAHEDNKWANPTSLEWFGSEDSWTRRHYPGPCENVILENNLKLNLRNGQVGKCFSLDINIGSEFFVEMGAELNVMVERTSIDMPQK